METSSKRLPIIEEMALRVLRGLEYLMYSKIPTGKNKNEISISAGDMKRFALKEITDLYTVAIYLQEKGLDFYVTFDLRNDVPHELHFQGSDDWEEIAVIKGESIEIIDAKIKELIYKINLKTSSKKESMSNVNTGQSIKQLHLLEDKSERKEITVYININYSNPRNYNRKGSWKTMYELAKDKEVSYDKSFFDYFNSNKNNPLYKKEKFKVSKILKKKDNIIIPNIEIELVSQKKVSQRLNSA
jgi:hypothetical protein